MNKHLFLIKKIHLFLISLEALNLYSKKYIDIHIKEFINENIKNFHSEIFSLDYSQDHQYYYYIYIIMYIKTIYRIIISKDIQTSTQNILRDYNKNIKSNLIQQYLHKFVYIYYKLYNYYECHNSKKFSIIYIHKLAIMNLYIIIKSHEQKGIFYFIEYLYKYKID